MKTWTETITKREGEWLGSIDHEYNINQYNDSPNGLEYRKKRLRTIMEIEELFNDGKEVWVWYDPIIKGKVLNVGMYDGWPYWKPTPAVLLDHWFGSEVHFWNDIISYEVKEAE